LIDHRVAQETGRDDLILSWMGQLIAGNLIDDKLVVRLVAIERVNNPIAIKPNVTRLVLFETIGIGIAGGIQPWPRPTLAEMRRGEQPIHLFFIRVRTFVGEESIDFRNGW